jgi:hypothetical protein
VKIEKLKETKRNCENCAKEKIGKNYFRVWKIEIIKNKKKILFVDFSEFSWKKRENLDLGKFYETFWLE